MKLHLIFAIILLFSSAGHTSTAEVFNEFIEASKSLGTKYSAKINYKIHKKDALSCRHFKVRQNPADPKRLYEIYEKNGGLSADGSLQNFNRIHEELNLAESTSDEPIIATVNAEWTVDFDVSFEKDLKNNQFKYFELFRFSDISMNGFYNIVRANISNEDSKINMTMDLSYWDICGKKQHFIVINPSCNLEDLKDISNCNPAESKVLVLSTNSLEGQINYLKSKRTQLDDLKKRKAP